MLEVEAQENSPASREEQEEPIVLEEYQRIKLPTVYGSRIVGRGSVCTIDCSGMLTHGKRYEYSSTRAQAKVDVARRILVVFRLSIVEGLVSTAEIARRYA